MGNVIKNIPNPDGGETRLVISDENWLEADAIDQLKRTAQLPGMKLGVGMPDIHPGKGQPIGAAFVAKDKVYPHLVGSDIGCGMGLWALDTERRKVKIDKWEKKLSGLDEAWEGDVKLWIAAHGHHDAPVESGTEGGEPTMKNGPFLAHAHEHDERLGTIGGGNHFAEIQVIDEVMIKDELNSIGLNKESTVLLVHSGSRGLGQSILRQHIESFGAIGLTGLDRDQYLHAHDYALRWAEANRALIAHRIAIKLGFSARKVLDVNHNTVEKLSASHLDLLGLQNRPADGTGEDFWIHRKGVSPTHSGLVMIPGSRGALSYLVKPTNDLERLGQGGYSLAHGAGRKWKRSDVKGRLRKRFTAKDLEVTSLGSRVICKSKDLLYEEAPQAYKNIDLVVDDLVQAGLVDVVASFKPFLTYKTRKK